MKYKLKKLNIVADSPDQVKFPDIKDRIIEKRGGVIEFTFSDVEQNLEKLSKLKNEVEIVLKHENAKMENIEHFHPFVKEMSEQDLSTVFLYMTAKRNSELYGSKLKEIDTAIEQDSSEMEEIKKQIPELHEQKETK